MLFMGDLDDFFESVKKAYAKPGGANWPARGKQIGNSFIAIAALNQLRQLKAVRKTKTGQEIASLFWSATQIRYILTGEFIVGLKISKKEKQAPELEEITEYTNYLLQLLKFKTSQDPFCLHGLNRTLPPEKVGLLASSLPWRSSDKKTMRNAVAAASSAAWAFAYDAYFANAMEIHGPYAIQNGKQMLVREYKFDWVPEVWPQAPKLPEKLQFYLIYDNDDIALDWELHPESKSGLALGQYAASTTQNQQQSWLSDGELERLAENLASFASQQVDYVNALPVLDKIRKGALLVYLQTKSLSDALGEDWRPEQDVEKIILEKGEENWNAPSRARNPLTGAFEWITIFDPRVPLD